MPGPKITRRAVLTVPALSLASWGSAAQGEARMQGAGLLPLAVAETRADLARLQPAAVSAAILTEEGRQGIFTFVQSDTSAEIAADPLQGLSVAPASDPTGRTGSWRRVHEAMLDIRWFGGSADGNYDGEGRNGRIGATDNSIALNAALSILSANPIRSQGNNYYRGGPRIRFPAAAGVYDFRSTVHVRTTCIIEGDNFGANGGGNASVLRWPSDQTCLILERFNTNGPAAQSPGGFGADGTILENLNLVHQTARSGAARHGVIAKCRFVGRGVLLSGINGDGWHILATAGAGGAREGNANSFGIWGGAAMGCRGSGIYVQGDDANAGIIYGFDASGNGDYGIWDSSFLGNAYYACHAAENGVVGAGGGQTVGSCCSHRGIRYALMPGQAQAASRTEPGTNPAVWMPLGPGGANRGHPAWRPGLSFKEGGAYRSDGNSSRTSFNECYSESGQGANFVVSPAQINGGLQAMPNTGNGPSFFCDGSGLAAEGGIKGSYRRSDVLVSYAALSLQGDNGNLLSLYHHRKFPNRAEFAIPASGYYERDVVLRYNDNLTGTDPVLTWTGPTSTREFGRGAAQPHKLNVPELALGQGDSARFVTFGDGPPRQGPHGRGEIVFNVAPAPGGQVGWVCVAAGSPGTWHPFGSIMAGP